MYGEWTIAGEGGAVKKQNANTDQTYGASLMDAELTRRDDEHSASGDLTEAPTKRRVLENLPTKQRSTTAQAEARSLLVARLRIALPILGAVLIAAFFLNTRSDNVDDAFLDDFANLEATPEELRMANPRFAGVDGKGKPYEITANAAIQAPDAQNIVELENPRAVTRGPEEETVVFANKGVFQSETNVLELQDEVTLEHLIGGDNYVLRTPAATVSIDDETVLSDKGVEGEGVGGNTLRADRMNAYNGEGRVVFEGNVRMRIFPKSKAVAPPAASGENALRDGTALEPDAGQEQKQEGPTRE